MEHRASVCNTADARYAHPSSPLDGWMMLAELVQFIVFLTVMVQFVVSSCFVCTATLPTDDDGRRV